MLSNYGTAETRDARRKLDQALPRTMASSPAITRKVPETERKTKLEDTGRIRLKAQVSLWRPGVFFARLTGENALYQDVRSSKRCKVESTFAPVHSAFRFSGTSSGDLRKSIPRSNGVERHMRS